MNKKIIVGVVVLCVVAIGAFFLLNNKNLEKENKNNNDSSEKTDGDKQGGNTKVGEKVLIVYFSSTNNTKRVAEKLAENLDGDLFEIEPRDDYTSADLNYNDPNSRVSKEHENESLRDVKLKKETVDDWDSYDTVLIGYPIWWGVSAWPVNSFVKANNFEGKTVIPFCTSASSGLGESGKLLEQEANGGNWLEGRRFSSRPSDSEIKEYTDSLK